MIRAVTYSTSRAATAIASSGVLRRCAFVPFASKSSHHTLRRVTVVHLRPSLSNNIAWPLLHSRHFCLATARRLQRKNSCINEWFQPSFRSLRKCLLVQQRRHLPSGGGRAGGKGKHSRKERQERRALKRQDRNSSECRSGRDAILQTALATSNRKVALPDRTQIKSIALRVPPFLMLLYGAMFSSGHAQCGYDHGISPGGVVMGLGASMIPTILPHDVVLWECISYRLLPDMLKRELQVGDVVIYVVDKDKGFLGARYITKRIVATGGMEVDRRGQHADLYGYKMNFGIFPDPNKTQEMVEDDDYKTRYGRQADNKMKEKKRGIIVPSGHLWLEGDNPLCSIDSRHYGPIPVTHVRGRVTARLFPWSLASISNGDNVEIRMKGVKVKEGRRRFGFGLFGLNRPKPPSMEDLTNGKYNCFRAP